MLRSRRLGSLLFAIVRPLLGYWIVLLIALPAVNISLWPGAVRDLAIQLPAGSAALGGELIRELLLCALAVVALLALGYSRRDSFLMAGSLSAPAKPIRFLMDRPVSWARLGPVSALAIAIVTGLFVALGIGFPTPNELLAMLPGVLVIAAVNSLNEEVVLRGAPLATLRRALGERQAIYLAVAIFAIPHFAGVPGGVIGSLMAAVFGWWVCKAMLETRGLFWPWVIHLASDVVIFTLVIGAAT